MEGVCAPLPPAGPQPATAAAPGHQEAPGPTRVKTHAPLKHMPRTQRQVPFQEQLLHQGTFEEAPVLVAPGPTRAHIQLIHIHHTPTGRSPARNSCSTRRRSAASMAALWKPTPADRQDCGGRSCLHGYGLDPGKSRRECNARIRLRRRDGLMTGAQVVTIFFCSR